VKTEKMAYRLVQAGSVVATRPATSASDCLGCETYFNCDAAYAPDGLRYTLYGRKPYCPVNALYVGDGNDDTYSSRGGCLKWTSDTACAAATTPAPEVCADGAQPTIKVENQLTGRVVEDNFAPGYLMFTVTPPSGCSKFESVTVSVDADFGIADSEPCGSRYLYRSSDKWHNIVALDYTPDSIIAAHPGG
jgi:hypothetical protein